MVDSTIILGIVALLIMIMQASVEYFKTTVGAMWLKLIMFFMAGVLNTVNYIVFGGEGFILASVLSNFKEGLVLGAAASGIYGMGKDVADSATSLEKLKKKLASAHDYYIGFVMPKRKQALVLMSIGVVILLLSFDIGFVGALGLILVLCGYGMATMNAAKHAKKYSLTYQLSVQKE